MKNVALFLFFYYKIHGEIGNSLTHYSEPSFICFSSTKSKIHNKFQYFKFQLYISQINTQIMTEWVCRFNLFYPFRRCLWIWQSVQPRLWSKHSSTEHSTFQQWLKLWCLFWNQVWPRSQMVQPRKSFNHGHCHQLLPSELGSSERQRRMVQSTSPTLRPRYACVPQDRPVPCRHRPRFLPSVS